MSSVSADTPPNAPDLPEVVMLTQQLDNFHDRTASYAIENLVRITSAGNDAGGQRGGAAVHHAFERGVITAVVELCGGDPIAVLRLAAVLAETASEDQQAAHLRVRIRQLAGANPIFPANIFPTPPEG